MVLPGKKFWGGDDVRRARRDQISKKKIRAHLTTNSQIQNATADGGELATITRIHPPVASAASPTTSPS
jgi:hypothetical protein